MPIIDPPLAYFLCTNFQINTRDMSANFYTHYLKIAADNYDRSYQSFNNLILFRNIIRNFKPSYDIPLLKKKFAYRFQKRRTKVSQEYFYIFI